jgi:FkbM family methyltransferase
MPDYQVLQIPGTRYVCLAADQEVTARCMQLGRLDWERSLLDIPEAVERMKPGATVIDVGAFIGDHTKLFEDRGCKVFALEPRDDAFACLAYNCPRAIAIRRAVGAPGQTVKLSDNMSNTYAGNLGGRQVAVDASPDGSPVLALDELNPHECALIKIDAEGFEPFVLEGGKSLITRTKPAMLIEVNLPALRDHGFADKSAIYEPLRSWGYKIREMDPSRVDGNLPWDIFCTPE